MRNHSGSNRPARAAVGDELVGHADDVLSRKLVAIALSPVRIEQRLGVRHAYTRIAPARDDDGRVRAGERRAIDQHTDVAACGHDDAGERLPHGHARQRCPGYPSGLRDVMTERRQRIGHEQPAFGRQHPRRALTDGPGMSAPDFSGRDPARGRGVGRVPRPIPQPPVASLSRSGGVIEATRAERGQSVGQHRVTGFHLGLPVPAAVEGAKRGVVGLEQEPGAPGHLRHRRRQAEVPHGGGDEVGARLQQRREIRRSRTASARDRRAQVRHPRAAR